MRNLAVVITIIFSILLIVVVWVAIIMQSEKGVSLNDLFTQKEVSLKDLQPDIVGFTDENQTAIKGKEAVSNQDSADVNDKKTDYFYIIIGSFKEPAAAQDKAEKLKSSLNGELILLPPTKEGYFRISFGKYSTREEAESTIDRVRQSIDRGAWIYTVKE